MDLPRKPGPAPPKPIPGQLCRSSAWAPLSYTAAHNQQHSTITPL